MKKPANNEGNRSRCLCPNCSLFTDCNRKEDEKFFCANTPSDCFMDSQKACICGGCPVFDENGLSGRYFCINGIR